MAGDERSFEVRVGSGERGRVFVELPFDPHEAWGKKRRHYVAGTLAGADFQGSLGSRGGSFFMPLNKELRERAGVEAGQTVTVTMRPDEAPEPDVPRELEEAFARDPGAKAAFEALTPFGRSQLVEPIVSAKQAETRERRVSDALAALRQR